LSFRRRPSGTHSSHLQRTSAPGFTPLPRVSPGIKKRAWEALNSGCVLHQGSIAGRSRERRTAPLTSASTPCSG
jgi:hypothetical protein